jgi:hypothetical protein
LLNLIGFFRYISFTINIELETLKAGMISPMKIIGSIILIHLLFCCRPDSFRDKAVSNSRLGQPTERVFTRTFKDTIPNVDSTFMMFWTGTLDKRLFTEIHYSKHTDQRAYLFLYTRDFFGKTIDSCKLSAGTFSLGKPLIEVSSERSITVIDSIKWPLSPYWIEIESASGERVMAECHPDTIVCCNEVVFKIGNDGRISSSDPNGLFRLIK